MGIPVEVHIRRQRVNGGLRNMSATVEKGAARLSYNFARTTEARAKRNVHVITGRLKRSIKRYKVGPGRHIVVVEAYYGVYEEYGTRYRPPHPFFRPAITEAKQQYNRDKFRIFHG